MSGAAVAALSVALGVISTSAGATPSGDRGSPVASTPAATKGGMEVGSGSERAVIVRGEYGVPSIYAHSMSRCLVRGGLGPGPGPDGPARADPPDGRGNAVGDLRLQRARPGRDGPDVLLYTPAELRSAAPSLPASAQHALVAFSDGINAYEDVRLRDAGQRAGWCPTSSSCWARPSG